MQLRAIASNDSPTAPLIATYVPDWDEQQTKTLAVAMLDRFVKRNELFGPERVVGVSLREREALLRILAHCKWNVLSRKPDLDHPERKHTLLAFRSAKPGASFQDEMLVSPSGNDLDFVLMPVDRRRKTPNPSPDNQNWLNVDRKQSTDRLYAVLETGHKIALPLTAQKAKKLKRIRNDLQSAADEVLQRQTLFYSLTNPYQQRMQGLADAFDTLIEGIQHRAKAPKPHKSKNKISPAMRHRNYERIQEEIADHTVVAIDMKLSKRNRIVSEPSREKQKIAGKRTRRRFTKHIRTFEF